VATVATGLLVMVGRTATGLTERVVALMVVLTGVIAWLRLLELLEASVLAAIDWVASTVLAVVVEAVLAMAVLRRLGRRAIGEEAFGVALVLVAGVGSEAAAALAEDRAGATAAAGTGRDSLLAGLVSLPAGWGRGATGWAATGWLMTGLGLAGLLAVGLGLAGLLTGGLPLSLSRVPASTWSGSLMALMAISLLRPMP
jgi:hypothetical protein